MRILTPVTVGAFLVVASIFAFAATKIWIKSRTLTALEMPVSLSSGSIDTGPFDINTAGLYSVAIEMQREDRLPLGCKFEVDARQSIRTSGPVLSQKDPTGGQYRWYTIMGHDWVQEDMSARSMGNRGPTASSSTCCRTVAALTPAIRT